MNTYAYALSNPVINVDPLGLFSGTAGLGGVVHVGPVGGSAESGIAIGSEGAVCYYSRVCGSVGIGVYGSIGGSLGGATGKLCSGSYNSGGFTGAGGLAGAGGTTLDVGPDGGISGARGFGGIGGGGYGAVLNCRYTLHCFNESECCSNEGACGCNGE